MKPVEALAKLAMMGLPTDKLDAAAELLLQVEKEAMMAAEEKLEERRQKDRERQSRYRNAMSRDITVQSRDVTAKEKFPHTPSKENTPLGIINNSLPPDRFDEWWEIYPSKKSKGRARKAWKAAKAKTSEELLIAALKAWVVKNVGTDQKFIPHPATWLNDERWMDADLRPKPVEPRPEFNRAEHIQKLIKQNRSW